MPDQADKRFAKRLGKEYETTGMKHNTVLYSSKTGLYTCTVWNHLLVTGLEEELGPVWGSQPEHVPLLSIV